MQTLELAVVLNVRLKLCLGNVVLRCSGVKKCREVPVIVPSGLFRWNVSLSPKDFSNTEDN